MAWNRLKYRLCGFLHYYMARQEMMDKKEVNMNMNKAIWRKARIAAAEKDVTLTAIVEHFIEEGLEHCKHDKIK
jgi:hypothetical protein